MRQPPLDWEVKHAWNVHLSGMPLPTSEATVLGLKREGYYYHQIAKRCGVTPERVRVILRKALSRAPVWPTPVPGTPEYFYWRERFSDYAPRRGRLMGR